MSKVFLIFGVVFGSQIPQIKNGEKPTGPIRQLVFEEVLRFGGESTDRDGAFWSGIQAKVAPGPDGTIYVADPGNNRVLQYDDQGRFVRLIGGEGQGPGEFINLVTFWVHDDGTAVALDAPNDTGRFYHYDQKMAFTHVQPTPKGSVRYAHASPDGRWLWAYYLSPRAETFGVTQGIMSPDLNFRIKLRTTPMTPFQGRRMGDPKYLRHRVGEVLNLDLGPKGLAAFGPNGVMVTAVSDQYELTLWLEEKKVLIINRSYTPVLRTQSQMDQIIDDTWESFKANIPPLANTLPRDIIRQGFEESDVAKVLPPLQGLLVTSEGMILAITRTETDGRQHADVFDVEGKLIGRADIPHMGFVDRDGIPNMVFRGPWALTMQSIQGDFQVVRYRYHLK